MICRWFGESNPKTVLAIYEALEIACPLSNSENQEREPSPPMPIPPKIRVSVKRKEVERREPTSRKDLRLQKEQKRVEAIRKTIQGSTLFSSSLDFTTVRHPVKTRGHRLTKLASKKS